MPGRNTQSTVDAGGPRGVVRRDDPVDVIGESGDLRRTFSQLGRDVRRGPEIATTRRLDRLGDSGEQIFGRREALLRNTESLVR